MERTYRYKLQGDGADSWEVTEIENGQMTNRYITRTNPEESTLVDRILQLPEDKLTQLKEKLDSL